MAHHEKIESNLKKHQHHITALKEQVDSLSRNLDSQEADHERCQEQSKAELR